MLHLLPATLPPLRRVWQLHPCPHPQQCLLSMWGGCAALQISSHPTPPIPILPMWSMTLCTCIPAQPSPWPQEWRTPCMSPALVFGSSCFESGWEEPSAGWGGGGERWGGRSPSFTLPKPHFTPLHLPPLLLQVGKVPPLPVNPSSWMPGPSSSCLSGSFMLTWSLSSGLSIPGRDLETSSGHSPPLCHIKVKLFQMDPRPLKPGF